MRNTAINNEPTATVQQRTIETAGCNWVSVILKGIFRLRTGIEAYRICFMYLRNKAEAEDAFQDVFLRFMQSKTEFESDEHEKKKARTVA